MDFPALTKLLSNRSLNRGELPEPLYYSLPELGFLLKGVGLVLGGEGVIYDHTAVWDKTFVCQLSYSLDKAMWAH